MRLLLIILFSIITGCRDDQEGKKNGNLTAIADSMQTVIFNNLISVSGDCLTQQQKHDSLLFLILPLEASCPSCRDKTIDSIIAHEDHLASNHVIILSLNAGKKRIYSYFKVRNGSITMQPNIKLDTLNLSSALNLHDNNPTFYYTFNGRALAKKTSLPRTIKKDLQSYFTN